MPSFFNPSANLNLVKLRLREKKDIHRLDSTYVQDIHIYIVNKGLNMQVHVLNLTESMFFPKVVNHSANRGFAFVLPTSTSESLKTYHDATMPFLPLSKA